MSNSCSAYSIRSIPSSIPSSVPPSVPPSISSSTQTCNRPWPKIEIPLVSVQHYLIERLRFHGSNVFLIEDETAKSFTFHQLANDCLRFAKALISNGIKNGDRFGIIGCNNYEYIVTLVGGLIAGGIAVPISVNNALDDIHLKIKKRNVKFLTVVTRNNNLSEDIFNKYSKGTKKIIGFDKNNKDSTSNEGYNKHKKDLYCYDIYNEIYIGNKQVDFKSSVCMIIDSNGTTETECNGCVLTHYNIIANLTASSLPYSGFNWNNNDIVINTAPFCNIIGLNQLFVAMTVGARLVVLSDFNYENYFTCIEKWQITAAILSPNTILNMIKETDNLKNDLKSFRKVICTGAPLPKIIAKQFVDYCKIEDFRQAYGLVELTGFITIESVYTENYQSSGAPTPLSEIKIINNVSGQNLGSGKIGQIAIKSPQLFIGYSNDDDKTSQVIDQDQWFYTNDIGYLDKNNKLYVIDRIDDFITVGEINISPSAIESILINHQSVKEAVVIGIPFKINDELLTGFVVLKNHDITVEKLTNYANRQLSKQDLHFSGGLYIIDEIPKNEFGIINRRKLREVVQEVLNSSD